MCYQTLYLDDAKFVEIIGPIFFTDSARIVDDLRLRVCRKKLTIDFGQATFIDISFAYALEDFFAMCLKKCYKCGYNHRRTAIFGYAIFANKFRSIGKIEAKIHYIGIYRKTSSG
ncbi:STAS domain-containing protein [Campylobacter gracilis]|uniref:STAS domain-containing protein n=1 Tax=Campylobacter gracilis TaxID=824 RepID=UPI00350E4DEE